jgi:hypothetical protein
MLTRPVSIPIHNPADVATLRGMSDIDLAVTKSKRLESLLEQKGATGRGLHEKADSIQGQLSPDIVRKIHKIAAIRNKLMHDDSYKKIDNRKDFLAACADAERALAGKPRAPLAVWIAMGVFILIVAFYLYNLLRGSFGR